MTRNGWKNEGDGFYVLYRNGEQVATVHPDPETDRYFWDTANDNGISWSAKQAAREAVASL